MTDEDLNDIALTIMAAAWIKSHAKDMVGVDDKLRLAAAIARVTHEQTKRAAVAMLQGLIDTTPDPPVRLRLISGGD